MKSVTLMSNWQINKMAMSYRLSSVSHHLTFQYAERHSGKVTGVRYKWKNACVKTRSLFPPEDQISLSACHIVAARKSFIGLLWNSASQCFKKICRACAICVTNKLSESCTLCSYVVDLLIAGCTVFDRFGWNSVYTISSCCHSETVIFAKLCRVKPIHYISVSMEFCQYFFTTRLCIG